MFRFYCSSFSCGTKLSEHVHTHLYIKLKLSFFPRVCFKILLFMRYYSLKVARYVQAETCNFIMRSFVIYNPKQIILT